MTTELLVCWIDPDYDRANASDGQSRYGAYVRDHARLFLEKRQVDEMGSMTGFCSQSKTGTVHDALHKLIDNEAARVLKLNLAARKIVDFRGPFGWKFAAVNTGRVQALKESGDPERERGLRFDDPWFAAEWPVQPTEVSAKDGSWPAFDPAYHAVEMLRGLR